MFLTLGGVSYDIGRSDERTVDLLAARWPGFVTSRAVADILVRLDAEARARVLDAPVTPDEARVSRQGEYWDIDCVAYEARLDRSPLEVRARYTFDLAFLGSLLQVVTVLILAERGGVLLHASSILSRGGVVVCPGTSGAGKTTLARSGLPRAVLSDEISAVRVAGGAVSAHATPFGDLPGDGGGVVHPVRSLVFPVRGAPARRRRLSSGEAALALLPNLLVAGDDDVNKRAWLDTSTAIVRTVPAYELVYLLPEDPWAILDTDGENRD